MFKVNRLTGYSIMLLTAMIKNNNVTPKALVSANELSKQTNLPIATVIKILKQLNSAKLIKSQRGTKGGYFMPQTNTELSFADVVEAIEGPINISDCDSVKGCYIYDKCPIRDVCKPINIEVRKALDKVKISDMASKKG